MRGYNDLTVYRESYRLALRIHQITLKFPDFEKYELASQMRRASKSIPLNIGEGYGKRKYSDEFKRFLTMSIGSCDEIKILLNFAKDLDYLGQETFNELTGCYEQVGKMLYRLHQNWR
jgi:four helix bundle protein